MVNKKTALSLCLLFLIAFVNLPTGLAAAENTGWFPAQPVFDLPRANLRESTITFRGFREEGMDIAEANVGGRLMVWGWQKGGFTFQTGIEGGVFSTFRLSTEPMELKNTDFRYAFPLYFQKGNFSGRLQVYHQSSHLGDTYERKTGRKSIHWSREKVDLLLARKMGEFRVYGGGGLLFDIDPEVENGALQAGFEYVHPVSTEWDFYLSQDIQCRAEVGWNPDFSTQTGFGFYDRGGKERARFFMEYFHGHSPEGQFFRDEEEWLGTGLTLFL